MLRLTEFLMNTTWPSPITTLTPPGWRLVALMMWVLSMPQPAQPTRQAVHGFSLGVRMVLNIVQPITPMDQRWPTALGRSLAALVGHAWSHAAMKLSTAVGLLNALDWL